MSWKFCRTSIPMLLIGLTALSSTASAQVMKEPNDSLDSLVFISERLQANTVIEPLEDAQANLAPEVSNTWANFRISASGEWKALVDKRSGRLEIAEGSGIPWIPGPGNSLTAAAGAGKPDLATLETIARSFLPRVSGLLGINPNSLVINKARSGQPAGHFWNVDFDVVLGGLPVEGARVVFRVSNGNLIQFGTENLPSPNLPVPAARLSREQAQGVVSEFIGGFHGTEEFVDRGSLRLVPAAASDNRFADGFAFGKGRGVAAVWQFTFRREGENATWRAKVDATTGEMLELLDANHYAQATGGARILGVSTNLPMPFTNVSSGGFTNSAGLYNFPGGAVTSTLVGQYIRIIDNCGAISLSADPVTGHLAFGTSGGNNCTTPGVGGVGNTHAARTQFYHLNRAKEQARGWLPANTWLNARLNANVNINLTCNAFWNGSSVNFYRSGGGCGNTGEIEAIALHEYGHGLDSNDGNGFSPDNGTGETYGDFTAALGTHTSCVGPGFFSGNCGGYGDACTACSGVRDIDWAKHTSNTPHTVANYTQTRCPTHPTYRGPCGREGHCESYIASEALWDFVNRDLPNPGSGSAWTTMDRLWYLTRGTATAAFACTASGTWSSNGCNTGSLWKTLRAMDDDDGNLANGTPHGGALYAAFNRHGVACTSDAGANVTFAGCTPPATPTLSLTAGNNQVDVSWTDSTALYDLYRNELGCNSGFIKVANNLAATSFNDTAVANGFTYYYQLVAHPDPNEACSSAPTTCMSVTPAACTPPAAPTSVVAVANGATGADLTWTATPGATEYRILRSTTLGGPYTQVGTSATTSFSDSGLTCGTAYYYVVRAVVTACESANSTEATVTPACPVCTPTPYYSNTFETGAAMSNWSKGTFVGGGSTYDWRGLQACTAHAGAQVFRFGNNTCTTNYSNKNFSYAQPNGLSGVTIPAGAEDSRLSFWHRRAFESGVDGGTLAIALGSDPNYYFIPASAILSGETYNGTSTAKAGCSLATGAAGRAIFSGVQASFVETVVDLDAACNLVPGNTTGCAGKAVRIAFVGISDCTVTDDGWFLDDVSVTACTLP